MDKEKIRQEEKENAKELAIRILNLEKEKAELKISLENKRNKVRNETDLPKEIGKKTPTISDIDSYLNNIEEIKDIKNKIDIMEVDINYEKKLYEIELTFSKILGGL